MTQAITLLLQQNSLQPFLHDRALLATSKANWHAYTGNRPITDRQRDIVVDKLKLPRHLRDGARQRVETQRDFHSFILAEALDFIRWSRRVTNEERSLVPNRTEMSAERTKFILEHLVQISYNMTEQDARAVVAAMRHRELDRVAAATLLTALNAANTAWYMGLTVGYGAGAGKLSVAAKLGFAKAAAAGWKGKALWSAAGAVAKTSSWILYVARFAGTANTLGAAIATGACAAVAGKWIWEDRRELGLIQYKDAAIFAAIQELNQQIGTAADV